MIRCSQCACFFFFFFNVFFFFFFKVIFFSGHTMHRRYPSRILYKSIAGRYRPVRVADGPITACYRFIKNASWVYGPILLCSRRSAFTGHEYGNQKFIEVDEVTGLCQFIIEQCYISNNIQSMIYDRQWLGAIFHQSMINRTFSINMVLYRALYYK